MSWWDLNNRRRRQWDWVQLEVTSWCNAACSYCPRTVYRDAWRNRHLSLATFRQLLPALAAARLIYLQGWGEPLLHPHFFSMVTSAKKAGCLVGTTTNGMLLDAPNIHRLVESGIDLVAFSLAGVDEKNDSVRRGTGLPQVLAAIEALARVKEARRRAVPAIHVAYMLLRSGLKELEQLPIRLQGSGVSEIVVSTLDFVASRELVDEVVKPANAREYEELKARLEELAQLSRKCGMALHFQLPDAANSRPTCTENVPQALVVNADGLVSPCVFANLPVAGVNHFHNGREHPYRPLFFGDVNERPLGEIWEQPAYLRFRRAFADGRLAPPCRECYKLM